MGPIVYGYHHHRDRSLTCGLCVSEHGGDRFFSTQMTLLQVRLVRHITRDNQMIKKYSYFYLIRNAIASLNYHKYQKQKQNKNIPKKQQLDLVEMKTQEKHSLKIK